MEMSRGSPWSECRLEMNVNKQKQETGIKNNKNTNHKSPMPAVKASRRQLQI